MHLSTLDFLHAGEVLQARYKAGHKFTGAGLSLIAVGVVLGQLSSSNGGRNFCLIVLLIAAVRLTLGGGIF